MPSTPGDNRFNFWSSFNAKPKSAYKFIVRFGDNAIFKSDDNINLSAAGFGDLKSIPNVAWLVKSVTRPTFTNQFSEMYHDANGNFMGYAPPTLDNGVKWSNIEVKFVSLGSHTFHPKEMPNDIEYILSKIIKESGYQFDPKSRTVAITDRGFKPLKPEYNREWLVERSRLIFEPFEIIDLGTDYLPDEVNGVTLSTQENTYVPGFGNPLASKNIYAENETIKKQQELEYNTFGTTITNGVQFSPLGDQQVFPVGKWEIYDPYITKISFGNSSYENDNQFIEYSLEIAYRWAFYRSYINEDPKRKTLSL